MRIVSVLLVVFFVASTAMADFTPAGSPQLLNSWGQSFNESGVGNYNAISVEMVSGSLEFPAFRNFSNAGWLPLLDTPAIALSEGPSTSNMNFDIAWLGSSATPLSFHFFAFDGDIVKEAAQADWNGSSWAIAAYAGNPSALPSSAPVNAVPLPATASMGIIMLIALAGVRKLKLARQRA